MSFYCHSVCFNSRNFEVTILHIIFNIQYIQYHMMVVFRLKRHYLIVSELYVIWDIAVYLKLIF